MRRTRRDFFALKSMRRTMSKKTTKKTKQNMSFILDLFVSLANVIEQLMMYVMTLLNEGKGAEKLQEQKKKNYLSEK